MRTNSKVINEAMQKHIINALNTQEHEGHDNTIKTSLQIVANCFESEYWYPYNKHFHRNNKQEAFKSWVCGAPSCVDISLWNDDIKDFLTSIGLPQPENKDDQDSVNLYFILLYRAFTKLFKVHNINF